MDETISETITANQDTAFEQVLDGYLPDIRILSRYKYPLNGNSGSEKLTCSRTKRGRLTIKDGLDDNISWFETDELSRPLFRPR